MDEPRYSDLLGTAEVSSWTGVPTETLRYWRHRGEGPASFKLGRRVVYSAADVNAWIDQQRRATVSGRTGGNAA
jgi:predicted DNA-binding transcriptional regulator AlpA